MAGHSASVVAALAGPFSTIGELIALHATERASHVALVHDAREVTFGELDAEVDRIAAALQRDGVGPGGVVALSAANSIDYAIVFFAALRAGAAVAPVPQSTAPAGLAAMVADSGATHLFVDPAVEAALSPHRAKLPAHVV